MSALAVDRGGDSAARGANGAEDIVGSTCTAGNASCRPFLLSSGVMTLLGPANRNGVANRVNSSLGVVGSLSVPGSTTTRAFYYSNGVMTDLGTLGGASSDARGLNDDGDVVGTAQNAAGQPRAFLWRNGVDDRSEYADAVWNRLGAGIRGCDLRRRSDRWLRHAQRQAPRIPAHPADRSRASHRRHDQSARQQPAA